MRKVLIGILAVALLASFVGPALACYGEGLSPGFWKHNLGIYLEERIGSYSDPGYTPLVSKDTMPAFFGQWTMGDLLDLYGDLNTKGGGWAGAQIRVAAANVFNLAADLTMYG